MYIKKYIYFVTFNVKFTKKTNKKNLSFSVNSLKKTSWLYTVGNKIVKFGEAAHCRA